ncbi:MAG: ribose-5-phosphate isomerase [Candidatus Taylorbacteria bacterium RIFOXYD2_FULL_36_9]|uniref:Ribose-5-phosphate isomerase n=1 Tax=Candidatus Taylorbacteria bacterium RIFOXYD2_FULL_36_9 TaxID=1802338 RepID=A0A1G2PE44_9BACT|nr:MAG: ribose-5-phosphate isomerase [Candidatus Taylorbacteria bacterium RIFOXYD2_FULL_36_9]
MVGVVHIGADHAGFYLKEALTDYLRKLNYEVVDHGAHLYDEFDDYPDFVAPVGKAVSDHPEGVKGIVIGGSGQGEAMVANQFPGVRAVVFYGNKIFQNSDIIKLSRQHNDANVLSLGARFLTTSEAKEAVKVWLTTVFSGEYKHIRRIKKIEKILREVRLKKNF